MADKPKKPRKIGIIIASAILFLFLAILSFIVPVRKSGCEPSSDCPMCDVCSYYHYNIWGMKIKESSN